MIYTHYSEVEWDYERWPNFKPYEFGCHCCGEYYHDPELLDKLQSARTKSGRWYHINSGHRCRRHNKFEGGAKSSEHLRMAFDISLSGHTPKMLERVLKSAGFTTFGYYNSFIHTDGRNGRIWYSKKGRLKWGKRRVK